MLILTCLTSHYSDLWSQCWDPTFREDGWAKTDPHLDTSHFRKLTPTWHDLHGRIIFTVSKGLVGVGLPRKGGTSQPRARITLPDGAVVQQWVQDDTLPTAPYVKERRWVAPFARQPRGRQPPRLGFFCDPVYGTDDFEQSDTALGHTGPSQRLLTHETEASS